MEYKTFGKNLFGRELTVDVGRVAKQANGSVLINYGGTTVLSVVTASKEPRKDIDFFPLNVEYNERQYAVGKIPGGFNKREGKPSENAILTCRAIDRPMRPLFKKDYRNDVTVENLVLSVNQDVSPELTAMIGSAIAVSVSDIPFDGPYSTVQVGLIDGKFYFNPTNEQKKMSELELTVSSTEDRIIMIEAGAKEVKERVMLDAIFAAHEENKEMIKFIKEIVNACGKKEKQEYISFAVPDYVIEKLKEEVSVEELEKIVCYKKPEYEKTIKKIKENIKEKWEELYPDYVCYVEDGFYQYQKKVVRNLILNKKVRPDGRKFDQIRPISVEVDVLPIVHGSAIFTRGETQICDVCTLAPISEAQKIDGLDESIKFKRYIHHYNFPSYSVGETKVSRAPGRREIGHGALAERALEAVLPNEEDFPYFIRCVSETFESNGSTSMASTCASCMALMDAGVPIKNIVAGISCGLITNDENDDYILLTDIQGIEDFFGDMDFKVTGSKKGITAIQMDIKIKGLTKDMIIDAIEKTRKARISIIDDNICKIINKPRSSIKDNVLKIEKVVVDPKKIAEIIGVRGKVINELIDTYNVKIEINNDNVVYIYGNDIENIEKVKNIIEIIDKGFKVNQVLKGKVVSIKNFGAFLRFAPDKEGFVHISNISNERINKIEDVLNIGDEVEAVCISIDNFGRASFSIKNVKK